MTYQHQHYNSTGDDPEAAEKILQENNKTQVDETTTNEKNKRTYGILGFAVGVLFVVSLGTIFYSSTTSTASSNNNSSIMTSSSSNIPRVGSSYEVGDIDSIDMCWRFDSETDEVNCVNCFNEAVKQSQMYPDPGLKGSYNFMNCFHPSSDTKFNTFLNYDPCAEGMSIKKQFNSCVQATMGFSPVCAQIYFQNYARSCLF